MVVCSCLLSLGPAVAWRGPCLLRQPSLPAWCLLRRHHRSHPTQATGSPWPTDTPDSFLQFSLLHDSPETTRCGPLTLPRRGCAQVPVKGAGKALPGHKQVAATRPSGGTRISPAGSPGDDPGPPAPPATPACSQETRERRLAESQPRRNVTGNPASVPRKA